MQMKYVATRDIYMYLPTHLDARLSDEIVVHLTRMRRSDPLVYYDGPVIGVEVIARSPERRGRARLAPNDFGGFICPALTSCHTRVRRPVHLGQRDTRNGDIVARYEIRKG